MYIRITPVKGHHYAQVVKSYREGSKVKQKILFNFGVLENLPSSTLESFVRVINDKILKKKLASSVTDDLSKKISGKDLLCYGYLPYKHLWKKFKLDLLLNKIAKKNKQTPGYDFPVSIYSMVINRLMHPTSKLMHYNTKHKFPLLEKEKSINLHQYYRSLEILARYKDEIESSLFERRKTLFNSKITILFYDVTTFHFESQRSNELLDFGFSKANKINEVQVVMGLLIDSDGIPIGYDLFPGNTFDAKTLPAVIASVSRKYNIERIILVGDKGINSKENLLNIKEAGFDYIVAGKLRSSSMKLKDEVLNKDGYVNYGTTGKGETFQYKVIPYINKVKRDGAEYELEENLICTYSSLRAESDKANRNRAVKKAQKAIDSGTAASLIKQKSGYKRFIKEENNTSVDDGGKTQLIVDDNRIKNEELFDGYYFIQTSDHNLKPEDVIAQYGFLYKIEESFRILKTTMKTRPVYHWNPLRIRGHFLVCFIALLLERALELKLKEASVKFSVEKIKDALNDSLFSEILIDEKLFYLKMKQPELATKIFSALNIKSPKSILSEEDLRAYLE